MPRKGEHTKQFILTTVAPIFNKNGYYGTSMSDITKATGLTKGAVYGNFKNKEDLSFEAFKYNVDQVVNHLKGVMSTIESPLEQLRAMIHFYRTYENYTANIGGCPIVNIGVDANHQNSDLLLSVQKVIGKLQYYIQRMIENGIEAGEIKPEIDAVLYSKRIFTLIEGASFMATTMNDQFYLKDMMKYAEQLIDSELAR